MKSPVPINIFLQALGGKFLGPNAFNNTGIQLSLQYSRGTIPVPYLVVPGITDDGVISTSFTNGTSSFLPILTMPVSGSGNPTVNYLTPDVHTIVGKTGIFLPDTNETAVLYVTIPVPSGKPLVFSQMVLLNPQQTNYTVTVVVPGLLLVANTNIVVPPNNISVYVAMMCGCKITTGLPASFWTYTDFAVSARVTYDDGTQKQVELIFDKKINLSMFRAPVLNFNNILRVNFAAQQRSTGNYGVLLQSY